MSFLEWMVSHMEYCGIGSVFGLGRTVLWWIVEILVWAGELVANLYKNAFKVVEVLWSDEVRDFISGFTPYLWIPIAISVVILGYNLIIGDDGSGSVRLKTFGRNLCLFILIMALVPVLFIGYSDSSGTTQDGQIKNLFLQGDDDNPTTMADGLSTTGDVTGEIYKTVAENVYDLQHIFNEAAKLDTSEYPFDSGWSETVIGGNVITINDYIGGNTESLKNIMAIGPAETIKYENVSGGEYEYFDANLKLGTCYIDKYDFVYYANETYLVDWSAFAKVTSKNDVSTNYSGLSTAQVSQYKKYRQDDDAVSTYNDLATSNLDNGNNSNALNEKKASEYLFQIVHDNYYQVKDSSGTTQAVLVNNNGSTKSNLWIIDTSTYPFRYYIEWGRMIVTLLISIAVLYLTSYKIVKLIYELTVNQLLVLIFGAFDLSNGEKAKEIIKASFSIIASIAFAVINVEFFFIIKSAINNLSFSSSNNGWIQTIMILFVGMATIKGPSILEKVLGYNGGLSDEWRETGALNRMTAKPVERAAAKTAKGTAMLGGAALLYGLTRHKGVKDAKKSQNSGGGSGSGAGGSSGNGNAQSGDASRFKMASGKKSNSSLDNGGLSNGKPANESPGSGNTNSGKPVNESPGNSGPNSGKPANRSLGNGDSNKGKPEVDTNSPVSNKGGTGNTASKPGSKNIYNSDASGKQAANADVARQGRDIAQAMQKAEDKQNKIETKKLKNGFSNTASAADVHNKVAQDYADKYKATIQNAALAEQVGSAGTKNPLNDRQALEKVYKCSGFTTEESKRLANRDLADGSFSSLKNDFDNSISDSANQKMSDSPLSYANAQAAYQEAAQEHLQAMGFSEREAQAIDSKQGLSQSIMLDDNQQAIRSTANSLISSGEVATDEEAVKEAVRRHGYDESLGDYDGRYGNVNKAASHILSQGDLEEGVVRGRIANNAARERATVNTHGSALTGGSSKRPEMDIPGAVEVGGNLALGYFGYRSAEIIAQGGYRSGIKRQEKKAAKRERKKPENSHKIK